MRVTFTKRDGPQEAERYRGFLLPAVAGAQIYIVRETSRNETLSRTFAVLTLNLIHVGLKMFMF